MGFVIDIVNTLSEYKNINNINDFNIIKKSLNTYKKDMLEKSNSELKKNSNDNKIIELINILGENLLNIFIKHDLGYTNYENIINQLKTININTYEQLENSIINNKFIKLCRNENTKILSGRKIKLIIFTILEKNNLLKEIENKNKLENKISYELSNLKLIDNKINKDTEIEELKSKRIIFSNLKIMFDEKNLSTEDINKKLVDIDEKIKNKYINLDDKNRIRENINDLENYLLQITDVNEINRIEGLINKYTILLKNTKDNFGTKYAEKMESKNNFGINKSLDNIINKYNKQFNDEEKEEKKNNFISLRNKIIKSSICSIINILNKEYKTNTNYNKVLKYFNKNITDIKTKLYDTVMKKVDNNYKKQEILYESITDVAKLFSIIYYVNNNDIELEKIYKDIKIITDKKINKDKLLRVKSTNKYGKYVTEIDNKIYIDYGDKIEGVNKNDIEFKKELIGLNVMVTKGHFKGLIGTICSEKSDYVLITKGTYGKNKPQGIPTLSCLKIYKNQFEMYKEQYKTPEIENIKNEYKELYKFHERKPIDLYPIVKYTYLYYTSNNQNIFYDDIFTIALNLYNSMMKIKDEIKNTVKNMKTDFMNDKKELIKFKKNKNNKEFLKLKRTLKDKKFKMEKYVKDNLVIAKINRNFLKDENDSNILKNTLSFYNPKTDEKKRRRRRKNKITKPMIKNVINKNKDKCKNILNDLLL